jgi:cytochrome b involved in lipid metabolism
MVSKVTKLILFAVACGTVIGMILFFPTPVVDGIKSGTQPRTSPPTTNETKAAKTTTDAPTVDPVAEFFNMATAVKCPAKKWSTEELKAHATPGQGTLLILIHGMVLNVTDFLPQHPGGHALLAGSGGVDGAELFTHYHQPTTTGLFERFCVGGATGIPPPV